MPRLGLGVGPSRLLLAPGATEGSFKVFNGGDLPEVIALQAGDFYFAADGTQVPSASPLPMGASSWISFPEQTFVLAPMESRVVHFVVTMPADALPGDHTTSVSVNAALGDEDWGRLQEATGDSDITLQSTLTAPVTVVARAPGEVLPQLHVPPFEAFLPSLLLTADGTVHMDPAIVNDGNVAAAWVPSAGKGLVLQTLVPTMTLTTTFGLGARDEVLFEGLQNSDSVQLDPLVVLPGATHTQHLTMTDAPLFGTYDYLYTLPGSAADGRPTVTRTGSFTIVNLQKVLLWVVLPLLVLMTLFALVMIRRHHTTTKRRMAEALRQRELQQARQEAYELARREQQHQGRGPW